MELKIGDKVRITDGSYCFGILNGRYVEHTDFACRDHLTIVAIGLSVMEDYSKETQGEYSAVNDILVTDGEENYWFTQSRFAVNVDKKIEVRYFCEDEDITNQVSNETKRNLAKDC